VHIFDCVVKKWAQDGSFVAAEGGVGWHVVPTLLLTARLQH